MSLISRSNLENEKSSSLTSLMQLLSTCSNAQSYVVESIAPCLRDFSSSSCIYLEILPYLQKLFYESCRVYLQL